MTSLTVFAPSGVELRTPALKLARQRLSALGFEVTLEPCAMCAMALLHARFRRVVFATTDPKTGAAGSVLNLFADSRLNHQTTLVGGVLAEPASALLRQFFADRRVQQRADRCALRLQQRSSLIDADLPTAIPTGDATEITCPEGHPGL